MPRFAARVLRRARREARSLLPAAYRRRTHLYCVGTAKSGTHSIAAMFARNFVTAHEPDAGELIDVILDRSTDPDRLRRYLLRRDRRRMLEVDSSQLNYFIVGQLVELFPAAKFLLTVRNPYEWLDSSMNHELGREIDARWRALHDFRLESKRTEHPAEEGALRERGLYPLDAYLSYWARHNRAILSEVPGDRLLVIRTDQIGARAGDIAAFAGIPVSRLETGRSHQYPAEVKFGVLSAIDRVYLEDKVRQHCGDLVDSLFPELSGGR